MFQWNNPGRRPAAGSFPSRAHPLTNPSPKMYANLYERLPHNGDGLLHGFMYGVLYGFVTLAKALEASGRAAPGPVLAGGSAAGQPRLRLFAKYAFEQRFLSKFTRQAWDRQACRGGEDPLWQGPSLDASALPIHPRRRLGFRVRFRVHEIRDHPQDALRFTLGSGADTRLTLGGGRGFLWNPRRRRLKQACFAGAQQPFGPALGQAR